jgi:hypothetical protein
MYFCSSRNTINVGMMAMIVPALMTSQAAP